jgi:hypothetical protein
MRRNAEFVEEFAGIRISADRSQKELALSALDEARCDDF